MSVLPALAKVFATLSLVSIGGANAVLPEMHRQIVDVHGWMTDAAFGHAFAIAAAAPGPNVILVSLIGWQVAGAAGLAVSTIAVLVPSSVLAFAAGRGLTRWSAHPAMAILKGGLVPLALGLILASAAAMIRIADHTAITVLITAAATGFVALTRRNPLWALATGAIVNGVATALFG